MPPVQKVLPSRGFAKLDSGIVDSTLWMKDHDVLRVWVAMLAKCDSFGIVRASVPAMAHLCRVTLERFEQILQELCGPDPYSRTPDHDGRRLQAVEGGWVLLNYLAYRELGQRKAGSHAERQARYRQRLKERDESVTGGVTRDADADADANADAKTDKSSSGGLQPPPLCPLQEIVKLYHDILSDLPRVRQLTGKRERALRARWNESAERQRLEWWGGYFTFVRDECPFLMGNVPARDRAPFVADLEWLVTESNFVKVVEGRYQQRAAHASGGVRTLSAAELES